VPCCWRRHTLPGRDDRAAVGCAAPFEERHTVPEIVAFLNHDFDALVKEVIACECVRAICVCVRVRACDCVCVRVRA
jgi:hypothetical protein